MKPIRAILPALLLAGAYVVRDLQGRRIGVRYTDLRSRGSNAGSGGVTIVVNPPADR